MISIIVLYNIGFLVTMLFLSLKDKQNEYVEHEVLDRNRSLSLFIGLFWPIVIPVTLFSLCVKIKQKIFG